MDLSELVLLDRNKHFLISLADSPMMSAMPRPSSQTVESVGSSTSSLINRRRGRGTSRMTDSWATTSLKGVD